MKKKILLVEDNQDISFLMTARLDMSGFDVAKAIDGEEALQRVRDNRPDLILMDLMIPKIDGFDVTRMIKNDQTTRSVPIIVISALNQQTDREKAIDCGADAFFVKPFEVNNLLLKINALTGNH